MAPTQSYMVQDFLEPSFIPPVQNLHWRSLHSHRSYGRRRMISCANIPQGLTLTLSVGILHYISAHAHMSDALGTLKENIVAPSAAETSARNHFLEAALRYAKNGYRNDTKSEILNRPKRVHQRQFLVISLHAAGWKAKEIAKATGYSAQRVSQIVSSKNPELSHMRQHCVEAVAGQAVDVMTRFRLEANKSLSTLVEIRDKPEAPASERRLSAVAILDRAGYSVVRKQINLEAQVPVEELKATLAHVGAANEVAERRSEWEVKTLPSGG